MPHGNFSSDPEDQTPKTSKRKDINIIDIQSHHESENLAQQIRDSLKAPTNPQGRRRIPSVLLWDQEGLQRFEKITYLDEYYLTQTEIDILERSSHEIARKIQPNSMLIELGSGNLRKIRILLRALDKINKPVDYYALDLSLPELQRTLDIVSPGTYTHVRCHGLWGTYDDGCAWLQRRENLQRPRCIISLGSTLGSFAKPDAAIFLARFADILNNNSNIGLLASQENSLATTSCMLVGLDACKDETKVSRAYNDAAGTNAGFIANALKHANAVLGSNKFEQEAWDVQGEWDSVSGSHNQLVIPRRDIDLFDDVSLKKGEKILVVQSHKYDAEEKAKLWRKSKLTEIGRWGNGDDSYGIHLLSPKVGNSGSPEILKKFSVPLQKGVTVKV